MVLVTGGTGFIGTHLVRRLLGAGQAVRCLVRSQTRARSLPAGVEAVYGDLTTGSGLPQALRGADALIHLAGVTKAVAAADYYAGNTRATRNLAAATAGLGLRLVHVSSLAAIGPSLDGYPVTEDSEPHPLTHYGKSKLEAELAIRELSPQAVILRPPVVYGPNDRDVFQLLKSISRGIVLEIAGGERWFSVIYVKDLVEGILATLGTRGVEGRAYFLSHAKPVSWRQFGAIAARIMNKSPMVLRVPPTVAQVAGWGAEICSRIAGKPGIVSREKVAEALCRSWTCDIRRAAVELGFEASTSLEDGLAQTLPWYKEAGWLKY